MLLYQRNDSLGDFPKHVLHHILTSIDDARSLLAFSSSCSLIHRVSQEQSASLWVPLLKHHFPHSNPPQSRSLTQLSPKQAFILIYKINRPKYGVGDDKLQSNRAYALFLSPLLLLSVLHLASIDFQPGIWLFTEFLFSSLGLSCIGRDIYQHRLSVRLDHSNVWWGSVMT